MKRILPIFIEDDETLKQMSKRRIAQIKDPKGNFSFARFYSQMSVFLIALFVLSDKYDIHFFVLLIIFIGISYDAMRFLKGAVLQIRDYEKRMTELEHK